MIFLAKSIGFLIVLLFASSAPAPGDLKIKTKMTVAGFTTESTTYIKGGRQRTEQDLGGMGMKMVSIEQCDLKRNIQLNDQTKTYLISPMEVEADDAAAAATPAAPVAAASRQPNQTRRGGIVTMTFSVTDTGERKEMFGFTARHLKSVIMSEASPDACQKGKMKIETDGWYITLNPSFSCPIDRPSMPRMSAPTARVECQDQYRYRRSGSGRLGFPLMETMTIYGEDGKPQTSMTREVTELSQATLDQALFDLPAGYREVKNSQEMYSTNAGVGNIQDLIANQQQAAEQAQAQQGESASAKQPGAIRIGVVRLNNRSGQQVSAEALRQRLIDQIVNDGVEAVPLNASGQAEIEAEARQKECDFILYTDVAELKQSKANKIGGFLGRATGANVVQDKYEARVDYRLFAVGTAAPVLASNAVAKEEQPAEETTAVALEKEASAVTAAARKRK